MYWAEALKKYSESTGKFAIPRKGTAEYEAVKKIQGKDASPAAVKAVAKKEPLKPVKEVPLAKKEQKVKPAAEKPSQANPPKEPSLAPKPKKATAPAAAPVEVPVKTKKALVVVQPRASTPEVAEPAEKKPRKERSDKGQKRVKKEISEVE
jgi:hypothetical protein